MSGDGQSRATSFPPPLWGRDRERGTARTASASFLRPNNCKSSFSSLCTALALHSVPRRHPSPCPSPTIRAFTPVCDGLWGEGTVRRAPSQLTHRACGTHQSICTARDCSLIALALDSDVCYVM